MARQEALSFEERSRRALVERGDAVLELLEPGAVMVEVGVHAGDLAKYVLQRRLDVTWHGVDSWLPGELQTEDYRNTGDARAHDDAEAAERFKALARAAIAPHAARATIHEADSLAAAASFEPGSVDLVFVDANHSRAAVLADCLAWWPVVRGGGWLGGHDYLRDEGFDVNRAVREFAASVGRSHRVGGGTVWRIRKP